MIANLRWTVEISTLSYKTGLHGHRIEVSN